jgi:Uma2 family endonuclease
MPIYAAESVSYLWLVDSQVQTLEVYLRHQNGHWLLLATLEGEDEVGQPPFDAVTFQLGALWP